MKYLPPLKSLLVFEAAARHQSFTQAAEELHVTQGAISRQIKQLESYLQCELFLRKNRTVELTHTGMMYAQVIRESLLEIERQTAIVRQAQQDKPITLLTTNAFASLCLMPHMHHIQSTFGEQSVRIQTTDELEQLLTADFDLAVFLSNKKIRNLSAHKLFSETVYAVCSPEFKSAHAGLTENELVNSTQIWYESSGNWIQWPEFIGRTGLQSLNKASRVQITNYALVLQAALDGQGVALGWKGLLGDYLNDGRLVRAGSSELTTEFSFYLFESGIDDNSKASVRQQSLLELKNWLINTFTEVQ